MGVTDKKVNSLDLPGIYDQSLKMTANGFSVVEKHNRYLMNMAEFPKIPVCTDKMKKFLKAI